MRKTLYLKFILAYIIFGFFGFVVVGSFVSSMITDHLTREKSEDLYREATIIANTYANDLYNSQTSLDTVSSQISALSRYIKATIWIINPSGRMVLDSSKVLSRDSEIIVENFDPAITAGTYYTQGDFFGSFKTEMLSVIAPISS
ncbi:MAG: two-component sensor histidine kinase, partial [Lachnospiraceae bacterium]|nr:two-component sensor histidine kinase [Lachnospiraceae bacterium]